MPVSLLVESQFCPNLLNTKDEEIVSANISVQQLRAEILQRTKIPKYKESTWFQHGPSDALDER